MRQSDRVRVFDGRTGRFVGYASAQSVRGRRRNLGSTATDPSTPVGSESTLGASLWAFLHPGQVQQEYAATGNVPPNVIDIMSGAASDAAATASDTFTAGVNNLQQMGQVLVVGLVALAAVELLGKLPRGK